MSADTPTNEGGALMDLSSEEVTRLLQRARSTVEAMRADLSESRAYLNKQVEARRQAVSILLAAAEAVLGAVIPAIGAPVATIARQLAEKALSSIVERDR